MTRTPSFPTGAERDGFAQARPDGLAALLVERAEDE
jgi:hypothetical protein